MKFCDECGSVMIKNTTATGAIVFACHCMRQVAGGPDDTLMATGTIGVENTMSYTVFIEQSALDPAANRAFAECPQCKLDFMTMIQVGENLTTMYTCDCGYRTTYDAYMKQMAEKFAEKFSEKFSEKPTKK